jgi:hypothetical protein
MIGKIRRKGQSIQRAPPTQKSKEINKAKREKKAEIKNTLAKASPTSAPPKKTKKVKRVKRLSPESSS